MHAERVDDLAAEGEVAEQVGIGAGAGKEAQHHEPWQYGHEARA